MPFETQPSNTVELTPRPQQGTQNVPSVPVMSGVAGDNKCFLQWEPVQGATGYKLYRATGAGAFVLLQTTPANQSMVTDSGGISSGLPAPVNGTTYRYQVTALGA